MKAMMMSVPLSVNVLVERAARLFPSSEIVSRLPDKSLVRHTYGDFVRHSKALAQSLIGLGIKAGDRVATCMPQRAEKRLARGGCS
jgi:fatty-acyl-CoA synthase